MARGSNRAWQRMLSGRRLDILDPSPLDVEISDIAHGLARVARWNGQTAGDYPFSVAQHSVLVLEIFRALNPQATDREALYALLHDAPEYVMGDIISPFKAAMGGNYKDVEGRLQGAVHIRFGLPPNPPADIRALIKRADQISAYLEATQLAGFSDREARELFGSPPPDCTIRLTPLPPALAQQRYLQRFETLAAATGLEAGGGAFSSE